MAEQGSTVPRAGPVGGDVVRRHHAATRLWHWINFAALLILLASGLAIFNAHPMLYWGTDGAYPEDAWLLVGSVGDAGYLQIGERTVETTGVLGYWANEKGEMRRWAFPEWSILPSNSNLAIARRWHLTFGWLFALGLGAFLVASLVNGHLRALLPGRREMAPRHLLGCCRDHAMLRFPRGAEAIRYNVLQKLSYLAVIVVLIPVMILTGLAMSPGIVAAWPWLLDLFGGRQSARSVHFIVAVLLVLFFLVHILMILLSGPLNHLRSMITGGYRLPKERGR
ncbi:hypothetical protein GE300_18420 [Rhodobacteraceae bacterium 2CG4]|uniref:Cytochrome b561 bacterial/Ni-hydrogenase domain-containing protein n=1 Tax=Halovulum marinum TaxID=2662447 RepID=A0A6L5Z4R8_9RHOB|nr:cytochrome b/b6 domain-containing protein [Halovulum marinum]MSU91558.1 hypothetical protein [Halovulum marinum]